MRALAALALAAAVACGGGGATPAVPGTPARPAQWPMFRGDAGHAGDYRARPTPEWKLAWVVELGERVDASAVITGDGRAIVATRSGTVVALDVSDGAERARVTLGGGVWATPAIAGDVVVVASKDRRVAGLDAATLRERWSFEAPSGSFSSITLVDGVAYFASGAQLMAVDAATGTTAWKRQLSAASFSAPALDDGRNQLIVTNRAGQVQAYSLDGHLRWDVATSPGAHNDGSPTIATDRVVLGSNDTGTYAFDLESGERAFRVAGSYWVVSTPAFADGVAYVGDDGGILRAIEIASGNIRWTAKIGNDLASSPTLVGDLLVHGSHDGKLYARNPTTGKPRAPIDAGAPTYASFAIAAEGTLVIPTQAGRVLAVR
jgi:outer membrane protein assembly factor BamB